MTDFTCREPLMKKILIALCCAILSIVTACSQAGTASFVIITDVHFDPFAACATEKPEAGTHICAIIDTLQRSPVSQWQHILATRQTPFSTYGQDPNNKLMQSSLNALQHVIQTRHADFVLYLGDFLGHHFDGDQNDHPKHKGFYYYANPQAGDYTSFTNKAMRYVSTQIDHAAGQAPVYYLLGNNDSDRGDNGFPSRSYLSNAAQDFHLTGSAEATFNTAGYYVKQLPMHHELIMLNTNVFSPKAKTVNGITPTIAAKTELIWLAKTLLEARATGNTVWIAMHVPVGMNTFATDTLSKSTQNPPITECAPQYNRALITLINRYQDIITGLFAAHIHKDAFRVIKDRNGHITNALAFNPAISPVYGNNAGFKVYDYDATHFTPTDYTVYYADLSNPTVAALTWQKEYTFSQAYHNDIGPTLRDSYALLAKDPALKNGSLATTYQKFYAVGYPFSGRWLPYYYCAIIALTPTAYRLCEATNQP